ncbi:hypothetical protein COV21_03450 [Candidatus Woesearchaeota archaeon CG10_big_fil_rev_8_21_14_0_10_45_5]|nr:MAG: hypothetical protein COV21_03450 [Candidatus Woesearchaeota archaeon CG10_big_fil_rev_8_21_14_0_10_45_5]PIU30018.1 MAG: hypothetical protein COT07_02945 [Candidatus Woesearchaeota archaeon CG07_land_8_20_14_0_80_44_23]
MGSELSDEVLEFVKANGPVLPSEVGKYIGREILISSALLSELVSRKLIFISKAKIGGSPVYYAPGQEEKLERLYASLNEKDRQTYDMLKEQRIIEDSETDPLTRVSLRMIRDFAVPFTFEGRQFWRWHLLPEKEAVSIAKQGKAAIAEEAPREKKAPEQIRIFQAGQKSEQPSIASSIEFAIKHSTKLITSEEKPGKVREKVPEKISEEPKKPKHERAPKQMAKKKEDTSFLLQAREFLSSNSIEIAETLDSGKKMEYDFIVKIPSNVGSLEYFCRARKKAAINEDDLSSAYVQAQLRKLPCLFITTGKLTKRASEILSRDFRNMNVKNI